MPSIMDIFSQTVVAPGTQPGAVPPGGSPVLEGQVGNNGQVPPQGQQQTSGQQTPPQGSTGDQSGAKAPESPLDKFSTLWQPPKQDQTPAAPDLGNVDPAKIQEMASKMDFAKFIPADAISKIAAGGEEATKAFQTAMQSLATGVFAQNTAVAAKLIDGALKQQRAELLSQIPTLVKQQTAGESLVEANPVLSHPAAKPIIASLQTQLAQKFPEATAAQLQQYAQEFLTGFVADFSKALPDQTGKAAEKSDTKQTDWTTFLPDYMR